MDIQKEREAFEEYIISKHKNRSPLILTQRIQHGFSENYIVQGVQDCWETWQSAKAQAVPEWILVENTIPNKNGDYIVCIDGEPCSAFFKWVNDHWKEFKVGAGITEGIHGWWHTHLNVTHWMPLPDAPQESTND